MTRQRREQLDRIARGLCGYCGRTPVASGGRCEDCAERHRERQRLATGSRPWQPGGPGRPPALATVPSAGETFRSVQAAVKRA